MSWQIKHNRFILFLDILGFKDLVARQSHQDILDKLETFNNTILTFSGEALESVLSFLNVKKDQIHRVIFSDSIIVFTKSNQIGDAFVIVGLAHAIVNEALRLGLAIKGAISYGEISVNIEKSIFFGQPLIDAYLLHDDLNMLTVILDHNAENMIDTFKDEELLVKNNLVKYEACMKYGKTIHTLLKPGKNNILECQKHLSDIYKSVSGKPRQYLDNTKKFYDTVFPNK
jgi:hypothetical protein